MGNEFLLGEFQRIEKGAHLRLAVTPPHLMISFIVVLLEPRIKVRLQDANDLFLVEASLHCRRCLERTLRRHRANRGS
jgi:hypothetical protein